MIDVASTRNRRLVKVSGIGADRPGIVYRIASAVRKYGGNILLQRSMRVAGEFAITLLASFEAEQTDAVNSVNNDLQGDVLGPDFIVAARFVTAADVSTKGEGARYVVAVRGNDRMGIVEEMALFLLQKRINIDAMESEVSYRPFDGTPEFQSTFEITVPEDFDSYSFSAELERIEVAGDLVIRVELVNPLHELG